MRDRTGNLLRRALLLVRFPSLKPTRFCYLLSFPSSDLHLERSLDQRDAIYILEALHPDSAEGAKRYVRERKPVLDSLYGGRVSFQVRRRKSRK